MTQTDPQTRAGFVAVIGAPNAGKSTLINHLVGGKVTIVSNKVQTTRTTVRGIMVQTLPDSTRAQIVFVDTPGLFKPKKRLERAMVAAAWTGRSEADMSVLIVDASTGKLDQDSDNIVNQINQLPDKRPIVLALNKIDGIKAEKLLPFTAKLNARYDFAATFMISALKGFGTGDLLNWLGARLPESPFLYPEDEMSDMPARQLAAEITREKLFKRLHDELPYAVAVETEGWEARDDGSVEVNQTVFVARESQRPIILGKGGAMIGQIGEAARLELEQITGTRIHLKLFVKVNERWAEDPEHYQTWGLDFGA